MHRSHDLHDTTTVLVVDPDPSTGASIREILDGSSVECVVFCAGREFLAAFRDFGGCLEPELTVRDRTSPQRPHEEARPPLLAEVDAICGHCPARIRQRVVRAVAGDRSLLVVQNRPAA